MPPKTPQELEEPAKCQALEKPPADGKDRTAAGLEPTPSRSIFLDNLKKVSKPEK